MDLVDKLVNRLTVIPHIKLGEKNNAIFIQKWLEKTTLLESLVLCSFQEELIDFSKLKPIPSVKKLEMDLLEASYDLLKEISRVFPCIEVFKSYNTMKNVGDFIKLIKEGKWPNLRKVTQTNSSCGDELRKYRPYLTCTQKN